MKKDKGIKYVAKINVSGLNQYPVEGRISSKICLENKIHLYIVYK